MPFFCSIYTSCLYLGNYWFIQKLYKSKRVLKWPIKPKYAIKLTKKILTPKFEFWNSVHCGMSSLTIKHFLINCQAAKPLRNQLKLLNNFQMLWGRLSSIAPLIEYLQRIGVLLGWFKPGKNMSIKYHVRNSEYLWFSWNH